MAKEGRNMYQIARECAGFTQDKASELLDISVESLRAYESDRRNPPNSVVGNMVEIYNTQYLAVQHLKKSPLGDKVIPDIDIDYVSNSIIKLQLAVKKFSKYEELLMQIGADNIISDSEKDDWDKINKEFEDIVKAFMSLRFSKQQEVDDR